MSEIMDLLKPQLDGMHEMYRVGYQAGLAEGRRQSNAEMVRELAKIAKTNGQECCRECADHDKEQANG